MGDVKLDLGAAELEVLRVLWEEGPATVRQVLARLHDRERDWAYTTVQTFLTRLEQKGFARCDKSGSAHVFRARISRDQVTRTRLRSLLHQLYDGAAGPLVLQLMRTERFTPQELEEMQKLIDRLDTEKRP